MKVKIRVFACVVLYLFVEALSFLFLLSLRKLRHIDYAPGKTTLSVGQKASLNEIITRFRTGRSPLRYFSERSLGGAAGWGPAPIDANSAGMRDNREYEIEPPRGIIRISAFGDSFTYGDEVGLEQSWPKRISSSMPGVEVLNYGVKSYGLDQAYVRYLENPTRYHPSAVLIGYMVEDLVRDVGVFLPFHWQDSPPLGKPRFELRHGRLVLIPNPLSRLEDYERLAQNEAQTMKEIGRHDYYYQNSYHRATLDFSPTLRLAKIFWKTIADRQHPVYKSDGTYNVRSEHYEVTVGVFDAFYRQVLENDALPIVIIFPMATDLDRSRHGKTGRYSPLLEHLRSNGYRFIDTQAALDAYSSRATATGLYAPGGHLSPIGNAVVAEYILSRLSGWNLLNAENLAQAAQTERMRLSLTVAHPPHLNSGPGSH